MLSVGFTVVVVGVGVGLLVGLSTRSVRRAQQQEHDRVTELLRHREVIADYEATIRAYRQFVHDDPELTLTSR